VEGSKLCLFSVIMPAKCVSSISPWFYDRRLSFCFLPLAAILESRKWFFDRTLKSLATKANKSMLDTKLSTQPSKPLTNNT
jgi:hypothetical protein